MRDGQPDERSVVSDFTIYTFDLDQRPELSEYSMERFRQVIEPWR